MKTLLTGNIDVIVNDIDQGTRESRHDRETRAVDAIMSRYFKAPVTIGHRSSGAPYIVEHPDIFVSISHSITRAAVAISPCEPVGIDTETLRPQLDRVLDRYLSVAEQVAWPTPHDHLTAWCIKEAAYKIAGIEGLDFVNDISIDHDNIVTVIHPVTGQKRSYRYAIVHFTPTEVIALVTPLHT